jgi:hypothetical protein
MKVFFWLVRQRGKQASTALYNCLAAVIQTIKLYISVDRLDKVEMPRVRSDKLKSFTVIAAAAVCAGLSLAPVGD